MSKFAVEFNEDDTYYFTKENGEEVHFENPIEHHCLIYNLLLKLSAQMDQLVLLTQAQKERLSQYERFDIEADEGPI